MALSPDEKIKRLRASLRQCMCAFQDNLKIRGYKNEVVMYEAFMNAQKTLKRCGVPRKFKKD